MTTEEDTEVIKKRPFGRTGHMSTRAMFGAWALQSATEAEADRTLKLLLRYEVNHIDTAASYGHAEMLIGPWMDRQRHRFFLATKTGERTRQRAREELHHSLERLRVERVDLWQLHNLVDPLEWQVAMGLGGALEAAVEAREQGLVRFIGVTGHGTAAPAMHKRSLERFDFDSVLLPYNYLMMQNPQYSADFEALMAVCQERNVAVQAIKSIARGTCGDEPPDFNTWYRPLEAQADIDRAVHWVLSRPGIFLNTVGDMHLLPRVLDAVSRFEAAPSDEEMREQVARLQMRPAFL